MSERFFISLLLFIFLSLIAFPQAAHPGASERVDSTAAANEQQQGILKGTQPAEITSKRLTTDSNARRAVFEGEVVARKGTTTLYADWMEVLYSDDGSVTEIHAKGNVRLSREDGEITSAEASYFSNEEKIIFTGGPVARDLRSTIKGSRMVYFIEDGRSVVDDSHAIINKNE